MCNKIFTLRIMKQNSEKPSTDIIKNFHLFIDKGVISKNNMLNACFDKYELDRSLIRNFDISILVCILEELHKIINNYYYISMGK